MSNIKISELRSAGSELFHDSESFLNELTDEQEIDSVLGGFRIHPFSKRTITFPKTFPSKTFPIHPFPTCFPRTIRTIGKPIKAH
ncbi:hypothetical protein BJP36_33590 [Moorena producens JHB]|uniref:Uncharacterized protein n=1 Tax=Moorena producens (strain JHB) TaxID=1454205 RepID=A0A1D9G8X8_MOOP1|nr:hypothetical protein [Moorena producens]AOY84126.1 hypothetical protein BJP36_33590 [Moorena producens JHB]